MSTNIQILPKNLWLQNGLSVLISLGLHGLILGLILPNWPKLSASTPDSISGNLPKEVRLTKLNTQELSRLPTFFQSNPNLQKPSIALPNGTEVLNNTPAIGTNGFSLTDPTALPPAPPFSSVPYYYPTLPSVPVPVPDFSGYPAPIPVNPQPLALRGNIQPPPPNYYYPGNYPPPPIIETVPNYATGPLTEPPIVPPLRISELESPMIIQQIEPPVALKPNSELDPRSSTIYDQRLLQERQQNLLASIQNRARSLQPDNTNTTDEEARKNYVSWLNTSQTQQPRSLSLQGIYPKDACLRKLEGTSVYGVLVNGQGGIINYQLIKSAGYPIFNQQALNIINSRGFANNTGSPLSYRVDVDFKYDSKVCPGMGEIPTTEARRNTIPVPPTRVPNTTEPLTPTNQPKVPPSNTENIAPPAPVKTPAAAVAPVPAPEVTPPTTTPEVLPPSPSSAPDNPPEVISPSAPAKLPEESSGEN